MDTMAKSILRRLEEAGHAAFFAGGSVRDSIRGCVASDIDIATSATPEEVEEIFGEDSHSVGKSFGVVIVDGYEVATFRKETGHTDGRRPDSVEFTSAEEDALRRDFTMNGIFMSRSGVIADYVGGKSDIDNKIIRAIGDPSERFEEDYLRMLRAVRFAAQLEFSIERYTVAGIRANAHHIVEVSPERVFNEINKAFSYNPGSTFYWLDKTNLMEYIFPEIARLSEVKQDPKWHPEGDAFEHTRRAMAMSILPTLRFGPKFAWAALLHDVGKWDVVKDNLSTPGHAAAGARTATSILERLRAPNETISFVFHMVLDHMIFADIDKMKLSKFKRYVAMPHWDALIDLHMVDKQAGSFDMSMLRVAVRKTVAIDYSEKDDGRDIPKPLIDGNQLIALGFVPGPIFSEVLTLMVDKQMDGEIKTVQDAVNFAVEYYENNS